MNDRSRSVARLLGVVILLAAWVATGGAQTQGGISGLVTDSSGAAVPGATVTVTNTATSGTRNTTTNAEGLYTFPALPPGFYELKVELQGFKTAEIAILQGRRPADGASGRAVAGRYARRDGDGQR